MAWLAGVSVKQVSVGFDPVLWRWAVREESYLIFRALPVGMAVGVPGRWDKDGRLCRPLVHDFWMAARRPTGQFFPQLCACPPRSFCRGAPSVGVMAAQYGDPLDPGGGSEPASYPWSGRGTPVHACADEDGAEAVATFRANDPLLGIAHLNPTILPLHTVLIGVGTVIILHHILCQRPLPDIQPWFSALKMLTVLDVGTNIAALPLLLPLLLSTKTSGFSGSFTKFVRSFWEGIREAYGGGTSF
jgi:hypothetical protein